MDKINFDIDEVGKPLKIDWYEGCKIETIAFGHGITTTILQLAKGYAIISNGGYEITPTLIRDNSNGGSAVWLADPNNGFIQIANNMPGTFSMSYSAGLTYIQKNSGSVPCNYSVGFYSNILS